MGEQPNCSSLRSLRPGVENGIHRAREERARPSPNAPGTQQGYDGTMAAVGEALKQAPGHILHMSHATEDGWRVIEVWHSQAEATQWFATYVAPNLPPGIRPRRTFYELHSLLTSEAVRLALQEAVEG
jgi:hypothetical protein